MDKIVITLIYDEIIKMLNAVIFGSKKGIDLDNDDNDIDYAYRNYYDSDEYMLNDNAKVKRKLTDHFRYLMRNVLYLDMEKYKAKGSKGSFFIFKKDAAIIKEILLRSVSQNLNDIIIGRWLEGKINDNDYEDIVELSGRLFYVINQVEDTDSAVKSEWIETLRLALRTDMAYAMTEVETTLQFLFNSSLQFKTHISDDSDDQIDHSYIKNTMLNYVDTLGAKVHSNTFKGIYAYMESTDFEKITDIEAFPPIELLKMKNICEYFYTMDLPDEEYPPKLKEYIKSVFKDGKFMKSFPNNYFIEKFTEHFISVDEEYKNRLNKRKIKDKERYKKKPKKSS